jgi:hypothetical protein
MTVGWSMNTTALLWGVLLLGVAVVQASGVVTSDGPQAVHTHQEVTHGCELCVSNIGSSPCVLYYTTFTSFVNRRRVSVTVRTSCQAVTPACEFRTLHTINAATSCKASLLPSCYAGCNTLPEPGTHSVHQAHCQVRPCQHVITSISPWYRTSMHIHMYRHSNPKPGTTLQCTTSPCHACCVGTAATLLSISRTLAHAYRLVRHLQSPSSALHSLWTSLA